MTALSPDLRQAIEQAGDTPPRVIDPETNTAYVLLRADLYERFKALFEEDPPTREEQLYFLREAGKRAAWDDPAMDVYNDLDSRRNPSRASHGHGCSPFL
jgi:hypothetical protein